VWGAIPASNSFGPPNARYDPASADTPIEFRKKVRLSICSSLLIEEIDRWIDGHSSKTSSFLFKAAGSNLHKVCHTNEKSRPAGANRDIRQNPVIQRPML
jgi:hypothetical protein